MQQIEAQIVYLRSKDLLEPIIAFHEKPKNKNKLCTYKNKK
jgi:hypothetical protein